MESSLACLFSDCHMSASFMYFPKFFFAVGVRPTSRICDGLCSRPMIYIFNRSVDIFFTIKILRTRCPCRFYYFLSFILFIEIQAPLWPHKYDTVRMDTYSLHSYVQHICKIHFVHKRFRGTSICFMKRPCKEIARKQQGAGGCEWTMTSFCRTDDAFRYPLLIIHIILPYTAVVQ